MSEPIIEVRNLAKSFGSFEAVKEVNFTVNRGDVFGFLGPNGAGKSTTIRCMLSLITPDKGEIRIFGKPLAGHRGEILRKVGCIIEKPDFYKYLSAERNLEIFARISGVNVSKREIMDMLDFVGLSGRGKDKVSGFSHGMKQRLGIAQTLLHNPELIILDEPTTGLDPQGIIDVRNLILRLQSEQHKTVLLSSHQLSEIEIIANRMVIINQGRSVIEGQVSELLNAEELIVNLEVEPVGHTIGFIENAFPDIRILEHNGNRIQLAVDKSRIPGLTEALVGQHIRIYSIESKRKLEDYFIKIVTN
ncbi:MAG: ABC transporter ATP-binding protein [Flavobacteriales bacterium]